MYDTYQLPGNVYTAGSLRRQKKIVRDYKKLLLVPTAAGKGIIASHNYCSLVFMWK